MFPPTRDSLGGDLKSWDFQSGRDLSEPLYCEVLRFFFGVKKCCEDFTKTDLINHDQGTQNLLNNYLNGNISSLSYSLGIATENRNGNIVGPTDSVVILEQMKRLMCGDRFFFTAGNAFPAGKFVRITSKLDFNFLVSR